MPGMRQDRFIFMRMGPGGLREAGWTLRSSPLLLPEKNCAGQEESTDATKAGASHTVTVSQLPVSRPLPGTVHVSSEVTLLSSQEVR